jgi:Cytochrome P460
MSRTKLQAIALSTIAALGAAVLVPAAAAPEPVPFPEGYRDWQHVKSMVIGKGHPLFGAFGGIHHLYANPKAVAGYRDGTFADGAVIVFDLLDAQPTADHAIVEGPRKVVGVMHRDATRYAATGGWGFEGFKAGTRDQRAVGPDPAAAASACFDCHRQREAQGFVFSSWRD